ncbi:MAG: MoaD/ThiS family protein [Candidatus Methylomirabilia bacterium]
MQVVVMIPRPLRRYAEGQAEVTTEGRTVGEVLADLTQRFPLLKEHLYGEDGSLKRFLNIYVEGEDIRYLKGERTRVKNGATVAIIPAIAGGGGQRSEPVSVLQRL